MEIQPPAAKDILLSDAAEAEKEQSNEASKSSNNWVTKRDRHMQLINSNIYDKEAQLRNKAIEGTRRQKAFRRDQTQKNKIQKHLQNLTAHAGYNSTPPITQEISVSGLRFHVLDGGSKLARIRGEASILGWYLKPDSRVIGEFDSASATPKQANVGGVSFLRSKNGNLYRSGIVKTKRYVHTRST